MSTRIEERVAAGHTVGSAPGIHGLISAGLPLHPRAAIRWTRTGRHTATLVDDPVRGILFVKTVGAPLAGTGDRLSLAREIRFHRALVPGTGPIVRAGVPRFVCSSGDDRHLVVEGLAEHVGLLDRILDGDVTQLPDPAAVAAFLIDLHRPPGPAWTALGPPARPHVLTFGSVGPADLMARPPSYSDLLRAVQPRMSDALRALRGRWSPRAVVHGDLSAANVLVEPGTGALAVVDWELVGCGYPAADLGALAGSLLWASTTVAVTSTFSTVMDWIVRLLAHYAEAADPAATTDALAWAAHWIVERVWVDLPPGRELTARARAALAVAGDLLLEG